MERFIETFCDSVDRVAGTLIALVTLLIVASALGRYLLAMPIPDAFDMSRFLLGACMMWGFASLGWRGGHIAVDLFTLALPERTRRWIEILAWSMLLLFVALLVWKMQGRVFNAWRGNELTFDLRVPTWPMLGLIWLGAVASLGTVSARIFMLATGRTRVDEPTEWQRPADDGKQPS